MPKGYIDCAMVYAVLVETLNLRLRRSKKPVTLHDTTNDLTEP